MDVSFSLGDSTYQDIDYMSLLNESLAIIDHNHTVKGNNPGGDSDVVFGGSKLGIAEKMKCFHRLVFERSLLVEDMCSDCLLDFIKVSHYSQNKYESFAQEYGEQVHSLETEKSKYDMNHSDEKNADALVDEVKRLQKEYEKQKKEERHLDAHVKSLTSQELEYDRQMNETMKQLNTLHYHRNDEDHLLEKMLSGSVAAEQEIHLLSSRAFPYPFLIEVLSAPSALMNAVRQDYDLSGLSTDTQFAILSVNGFRVAFSPDSKNNLNWAEINAGWSSICTAFWCYCCKHSRYTALREYPSNAFKEEDSFHQTCDMFSYELVCLRHTAVLVESPRRDSFNKESGSRKSYCLHHKADNSLDVYRGSNHEYIMALLSLAIIVIEAAVAYCRLDVMTSFSTLSYLYGFAKPQDMSCTHCHPEMLMLMWPNLEVILAHSDLQTESRFRELVNDILMAIYYILHP